jgi:hypothetical protein
MLGVPDAYAQKGVRDTHDYATGVDQGIGLDFGFIFQRPSTRTAMTNYGASMGKPPTFSSWTTTWTIFGALLHMENILLNRWLTQYHPASVPYRYTVMDNGGELVNNGEVLQILEFHEHTLLIVHYLPAHQPAIMRTQPWLASQAQPQIGAA